MIILITKSHRHLALEAETADAANVAADAAGAAADAAGAERERLGGALAEAQAELAAAAARADEERAAAAAAAEAAAVEIDAWRIDAAGSVDHKASLVRSLEAAEEMLSGLRLEVRTSGGGRGGGRHIGLSAFPVVRAQDAGDSTCPLVRHVARSATRS